MLQGVAAMGDLRGVSANLGHGMVPSHDPKHAGAFVRAVQNVSASMIAS